MKCYAIDASNGAHIQLTWEGGSITGYDELIRPLEGAQYIAPGLIDLQVNGYAGVDYNHPSTPHEEIARSIRAQYAAGVTRLLPTVITNSPEAMLGCLRNLARARTALREGKSMAGFHVEGPHISPDDGPRGAHPRQWVRPPDVDEYRRWQDATDGGVKLVTVAPEWPGAVRYIERLTGEGVVAAIGHTQATAEQLDAAVRAGATLSTHLGNGSHAMLPRHPNYTQDQLGDDRLAASFIVDGIHLPACFFRVAVRAKGLTRSLLVTDAAPPAGAAPGAYRFGEIEVELTAEGRVMIAGTDRLAGSALRMDRAVENAMRQAGLTLAEALTLATRNPARIGRIPGRLRGLRPGDDADFIVFDFDEASGAITIHQTVVKGREVYSSP